MMHYPLSRLHTLAAVWATALSLALIPCATSAATELPTRPLPGTTLQQEPEPAMPHASDEAALPETSTDTAPKTPADQATETKPEGFSYPEPPPLPKTDDEAATLDEFEKALASVYINHPQLKAQREALEASDEGVAQAISGFRPTATANYSRGRARNNNRDNTWFYGTNENESLLITQPVFRGGSTLASYASAKDRVKAGRAQLTALEQEILLAAVIAYTDVVEKKSVLEVNQHNVDVLARQLKASQARFDVGELTRTDVAQSQARLASAQAAERQALGNLAASSATFRRVIGYDPAPDIALPPVPDSLPQSLDEATRWAEANNPTLEAARHIEKATENDVDNRTGGLLPSVDLEGSITRRNAAIAGLFTQVENKSDQLLLNVTVPLYQSGAEWSRIREARNLAQQAKFTTIDTRYSVVENVARAWQDYHTARAIITSNEEAVHAAQEALDGVRQENLYGTRTILDVLDTEQDFFNARVNLVIATVAEKQQAYRLLATTGRLTAKELKLAVDLIDPRSHYDKVKYQLIGF